MAYIEEMRTLIGHRPLVLVGAAVLVTDARGWLLLGQRSDNLAWGIPGGALEPGETLEETARRETHEETGLEIGRLRLFRVFSGPEFFYTYPNGDQVHNVSAVFESSDFTGSLLENSEHRLLRFFDPDHLPESISPPVFPVLRAWLARGRRMP